MSEKKFKNEGLMLSSPKQIWLDFKSIGWVRRSEMMGLFMLTIVFFFLSFGHDKDGNFILIKPQDFQPVSGFFGLGEPSLRAYWFMKIIGLIGSLLMIPTNILWISGKRSAYTLALIQNCFFVFQFIVSGLTLQFIIQTLFMFPLYIIALRSWSEEQIKVKRLGPAVIVYSLIGIFILFFFWVCIQVLIFGTERLFNGTKQELTGNWMDLTTNITIVMGNVLLMKRERMSTVFFIVNDIIMFLIFTPLTPVGFTSLELNVLYGYFTLSHALDIYYWWFKLEAEKRSSFKELFSFLKLF